MEQPLVAGYGDALSSESTEYNSCSAGSTWNVTEQNRQQVAASAGKLTNFYVELHGSPGAGKSYTFTLRINGVDTALVVAIADAATSGSDLVNEVNVSAGDLLSISCVPAGTPTARKARWSMLFEGTTAKESLVLGVADTSNVQTVFAPTSQSSGATDSDEPSKRQICPTSGKLKNLYVNLDVDPGIAPDAYRFTLRVNGVDSALTVTIPAPATTGSDLVNEVVVSAGQALTYKIEPLNSPASYPKANLGMTFVADTDGESLILGGTNDNLSTSATEYNQLLTRIYSGAWTLTETDRDQLAQQCVLKNLYVLLSGAPGGGKSYTFTVRQNGADSALVVTIADAAVSGNDIVNTVNISNEDVVDLKSVPAGTPASMDGYWGVVAYISPPVAVSSPGNVGMMAMAMGV